MFLATSKLKKFLFCMICKANLLFLILSTSFSSGHQLFHLNGICGILAFFGRVREYLWRLRANSLFS